MFKQIKSIIVERIHFRDNKHAVEPSTRLPRLTPSGPVPAPAPGVRPLLRCRRWMGPLLWHICQSAVGNRFVNLVITCHSAVVATLWALLKQSVNSFELAQSGQAQPEETEQIVVGWLFWAAWLLFASSRFVRPLAVPVAWSGLVCSVCLPIVWIALTCEALGQYLSPTRCANVPSVVAVGLQLSPCSASSRLLSSASWVAFNTATLISMPSIDL